MSEPFIYFYTGSHRVNLLEVYGRDWTFLIGLFCGCLPYLIPPALPNPTPPPPTSPFWVGLPPNPYFIYSSDPLFSP